MNEHEDLLREALRLSIESVEQGGGPFGAVIVREGKVVGHGCNRVAPENDPTAHAEVVAIRTACRTIQSFRLDGCILYASCEPCPMCLAASYWARLEQVYYSATSQDATDADFDDGWISRELTLPAARRSLSMQQLLPAEAGRAFDLWHKKHDRTEY